MQTDCYSAPQYYWHQLEESAKHPVTPTFHLPAVQWLLRRHSCTSVHNSFPQRRRATLQTSEEIQKS
ncbi:Hypothetical protein FKW44_010378 [Caligus rogercresseyi]|uniref:Uncharacterized protein n=1 Tax=Caligus rogercresseyi TaxID=217165 RepID=A0A7T8HGH9_CALRO|nr:Hypothetical protein FKW44_010378 [Caligus rogercresseyi]